MYKTYVSSFKVGVCLHFFFYLEVVEVVHLLLDHHASGEGALQLVTDWVFLLLYFFLLAWALGLQFLVLDFIDRDLDSDIGDLTDDEDIQDQLDNSAKLKLEGLVLYSSLLTL